MQTFLKARFVLLLLGGLILSACGSGSSSDNPSSSSVEPSGIWLGYQESHDQTGSSVFDMKTIIYDGRFVGISEDANIMFAGSYQMHGGKYLISNGEEGAATTYRMYGIHNNGKPFARGITTLSFAEKDLMQGVFENEALQEGAITSHYSSLTTRGAYLPHVTGTVGSFSLDSSGTLSGTKETCSIEGTVLTPRPDINIYDLSYDLSGPQCEKAGAYQGIGIVALDDQSKAYFLALSVRSDASRMDRIAYYLAKTPSQFVSAAPSAVEERAASTVPQQAAISQDGDFAAGGNSPQEDEPAPANFAGAWWTDGTRCGAVSLNGCSERTYDSGLSYEDIMSRSSNLKDRLEEVSLSVQEEAQNGTNFYSNAF